jgi:hypothetical protein
MRLSSTTYRSRGKVTDDFNCKHLGLVLVPARAYTVYKLMVQPMYKIPPSCIVNPPIPPFCRLSGLSRTSALGYKYPCVSTSAVGLFCLRNVQCGYYQQALEKSLSTTLTEGIVQFFCKLNKCRDGFPWVICFCVTTKTVRSVVKQKVHNNQAWPQSHTTRCF